MIRLIILVISLTCFSSYSYAIDKCLTKLENTSKYSDLNAVIKCLNNNIKYLNNEVIKLKNDNSPLKTPDISRLTSGQRFDAGGFTFRLLNCKLKGGAVLCKLSIVNSGEDKKISLYTSTRAIDFNGKEYLANAVTIGGSRKSNYAEKMMVSDVPMVAEAYFPAVSRNITGFSLVELHIRNNRIKFKNVKVE